MTELIDRIFAHQSFQAREQRVLGITTATVDKVEDHGMYHLKIHGMNGQSSDDPSAPARMMSPMASANYGAYFFPEKGDEVVVAFIQGDPNMPVILGAVYNQNSAPPSQANQSTDNNVRTIVTRSGHELTFDDTQGSQKVTLKTQGGHKIVLDDNPSGPKVTISSNGGREVLLDDTPPGQIQIQSPTCQITMVEAGQLSISATTSISLSAPSISISGTNVSISAAAGTSTIDNTPFLFHTHAVSTAPGVTGPVSG